MNLLRGTGPAVLCLLALGTGLAPATAGAKVRQLPQSVPEPPLRGFDTASPIQGFRIPGGPLNDLNRTRNLGANTVRLTVQWDRLQTEPGEFHAERAKEMDKVFKRARQQKIGVVMLFVFSPCWASSAPRGLLENLTGRRCSRDALLYPPRDPTHYGMAVKQAVNRWGRTIAGVEVWNEPNHDGFYRGTPQQYVELVRQAKKAVRASHYKKIPVVGGSLSGADAPYLEHLLASGISRWADAISIHPYDIRFTGAGFSDPSIPRQNDIWSFAYGVPNIHELMLRHNSNDPIWITEFGYADCPAVPYCVTPALQASYLAKAVELAASWSYVDAFLIYRLRDWLPQDGTMNSRFGVLQRDGARKPAAQALAKLFQRLAP